MNNETGSLVVRRKIFFTIAHDSNEYLQNIVPTEDLIKELRKRRVDIFSFLERKWCCPIEKPSETWIAAEDNIGLLHITSYDDWKREIGKKTRNMIRKAEKMGVKADVAKANDKFAEGIWKIYNETPIRQGRGFPHYGISLETVKRNLLHYPDSVYIGAYLQGELVGFIHLILGDRLALISQLLSMQSCWDKAVNNALLAKAVEFCASNHSEWVMYGRMGNHPTLDGFKESNGFSRFQLTRYFLPLTAKGRLAIRLRLNRELKDSLPPSVKKSLFPIYNWVSRMRAIMTLPRSKKPVP